MCIRDRGYGGLQKFIFSIEDVDKLKKLKPDFEKLTKIVSSTDKQEGVELVSQLETSLKSITGTYDIIRPLSKIKKELKRKKIKLKRIQKSLDKTIKLFNSEIFWREKGKTSLLPSLTILEKITRGNIGLRKQTQIPPEQAKEILYCQTFHKDLSLYF